MNIIKALKSAFESRDSKRQKSINSYFEGLPNISGMPLKEVRLSQDAQSVDVLLYAFRGSNLTTAEQAVSKATPNAQSFVIEAGLRQTEIDDLISVSIRPTSHFAQQDLKALAVQVDANLHATYGKRANEPKPAQ